MNILRQAAAVPFRCGPSGPEFLLITSRGRGDWIFPKGIVEAGETPAMTAAKEAGEESGIAGAVEGPAFASYAETRRQARREVEVFLFRYQGDLPRWDEGRFRRRRWCGFEEATALIRRRELAEILARAHRILASPRP
jgi:8-oxo-dGTP pyrophosphatase MutT (NUDIX family)